MIKFPKYLSIIAVMMAMVLASASEGPSSADQALKNLTDGNARFVSGTATHPHQDQKRLAETVSAQHPFAIVVGCSDSRVPPEVIFDQGIGDIFVVRTAGEVMDNATLGSIEYGVEHLGAPLVVVLGHDSCGAVKAAVEGGEAEGQIAYLVEAIKPAVDQAKSGVSEGDLTIIGARYHLNNGTVAFMD